MYAKKDFPMSPLNIRPPPFVSEMIIFKPYTSSWKDEEKGCTNCEITHTHPFALSSWHNLTYQNLSVLPSNDRYDDESYPDNMKTLSPMTDMSTNHTRTTLKIFKRDSSDFL